MTIKTLIIRRNYAASHCEKRCLEALVSKHHMQYLNEWRSEYLILHSIGYGDPKNGNAFL